MLAVCRPPPFVADRFCGSLLNNYYKATLYRGTVSVTLFAPNKCNFGDTDATGYRLSVYHKHADGHGSGRRHDSPWHDPPGCHDPRAMHPPHLTVYNGRWDRWVPIYVRYAR